MFRAAMECMRQRERYARLVASGAHDLEQLAALRVAGLCDEILDEAVAAPYLARLLSVRAVTL